MSLIEIHSHLIARTTETPNPDFRGEEKTEMELTNPAEGNEALPESKEATLTGTPKK